MGLTEILLWIAGAVILTAPYAIWHWGVVGLRFGFSGLGVGAIVTLWFIANDAPAAMGMLSAWLGAFSYVAVFALIAHAAGRPLYGEGAE